MQAHRLRMLIRPLCHRITQAPPKANGWLHGQLGVSRISASGAGLLILRMQSAKQPLTYCPNHRRGHESWVMGKPGSPSLAFPYASHRILRPIGGKGVCGGPSEGVRDASSPSLSVSARGETREACSLPPVRSYHVNHIAVDKKVCWVWSSK